MPAGMPPPPRPAPPETGAQSQEAPGVLAGGALAAAGGCPLPPGATPATSSSQLEAFSGELLKMEGGAQGGGGSGSQNQDHGVLSPPPHA